jgi:hypothetical protein
MLAAATSASVRPLVYVLSIVATEFPNLLLCSPKRDSNPCLHLERVKRTVRLVSFRANEQLRAEHLFGVMTGLIEVGCTYDRYGLLST